jgi:hypothetical protein
MRADAGSGILLLDCAAGNPRVRVARGVGLVVVRPDVDHEHHTPAVVQGIGARSERHVRNDEVDLRFSAGIHVEVRQVAGVCSHLSTIGTHSSMGIHSRDRENESLEDMELPPPLCVIVELPSLRLNSSDDSSWRFDLKSFIADQSPFLIESRG